MLNLSKVTLLSALIAGALTACGRDLSTNSSMLDETSATAITFQAYQGVSQTEIDALKSITAALLEDALTAGFAAVKIPSRIYILDGYPTVSGHVDARNANNGFVRIYKGLTKDELSYGLFSLGLKDNNSGLVLVPTSGTTLADIIKIRDLAAEVTAAVNSSSFVAVKPASKIYILDGQPAVDSNIDANNVTASNSFLRVAKTVTRDEFASGFFRVGLKDIASGMTFVTYEGVSFADTQAVRDAATTAITAETMALLGLASPLKLSILDGWPTISGKVDASNATIGWLRVAKDVTAPEIKAVLPQY